MLASRVQVLRNKGYALSGDEDALKQKLQQIDKSIQDPALSARMEELWSRLIILRGYADNLKDEINKPGLAESDGLGEEIEAKAKKVCGPSFGRCGRIETNTARRFLRITTSNFSISKSRWRRPGRISRIGRSNIIRHRHPRRRSQRSNGGLALFKVSAL
jgi:hypothetical protein